MIYSRKNILNAIIGRSESFVNCKITRVKRSVKGVKRIRFY